MPYRTFITFIPTFKAGDPPPSGYVAWHEWAKVQGRAGLRQRKCRRCDRYKFPQELDRRFKVLTCKACAKG